MSQTFALPCSCGASIPVEIRQAGDQVQCSKCEKFVEVPRLRELKQLEPLSDAAPIATTNEYGTSWSGIPGALFAMGLLAFVIAGAAAYYVYSTRTQMAEFAVPPQEKIEFERDINEITLVDSWETWNQFKEIQLIRRPQPIHVLAQSRVDALTKWLTFFGGLATLGLVFMAVAFLVQLRR